MVKGEAMKLVWQLDYLKVLHKEPFKVTKFDQHLSMIYKNKIKALRKNINDHLEMDLDYSDTVVVKVLTIKHLKKVLDEFPEELRGTSATLEANICSK